MKFPKPFSPQKDVTLKTAGNEIIKNGPGFAYGKNDQYMKNPMGGIETKFNSSASQHKQSSINEDLPHFSTEAGSPFHEGKIAEIVDEVDESDEIYANIGEVFKDKNRKVDNVKF